MKLKRLECEVARMEDDDGIQYLRLQIPEAGEVWYRPTDFGFVLTSDAEADELEVAYKGTLL